MSTVSHGGTLMANSGLKLDGVKARRHLAPHWDAMGIAKPLAALFTALSVGAFLAFARFCHLADIAMPKPGGGNLPEFEHYSRLAGVSFLAIVISWVLAVISAQLSPQPFRGRALFALGVLLPIAFVTAYVGLVIS